MLAKHIFALISALVGLSVCLPSKHFSPGPTVLDRKPTNVSHRNFCFQDLCTCDHKRADCSGNNGRLKYVPKLPGDIQNLDFSYNKLRRISRDNYFCNVTQIVVLNLENNGLEYISKSSFRALIVLGTLYLGFNNLTYMSVAPVFWAKRLSELHLAHTNLGPVPENWLVQEPLPPLLKLDLSDNPIEHLHLSTLTPLDRLQHLRLSGCHIYHVTSAYVPQLTLLELGSNFLFDLPSSCNNGTSMFPMLQEINFSGNRFSAFSGEICLPQLEILDLSRNPIDSVETDMFNNDRFPKLTTLSLASVTQLANLQEFAFRSSSLSMLSLMYCGIYFGSTTVHPDCFAGLENLEYFEISFNQAHDISGEKLNRLFGSLNKLKYMYMAGCDLSEIDNSTFSQQVSLTTINLYGNKIKQIPDGAFDSLTNLTTLVLGDNRIKAISETTFRKTTRMQLLELDISRNPFVCSCDILWFQKWFLSSPSLFGKGHRDYTCVNMNKLPLASFRLTDQACIFSPETSKAIMACVLMNVFLLLIVSIVYQFRWHIRLMLAFRGHGEIMRRRFLVDNFTYDVFLSCAEEDEAWVVQHLLPHLERNQRLRVCFHKRDFLPGKSILDNIVDGVKRSKKYVLVFSKHFALSRWCQFELDLCLGHVLDNDDALVVLLLDDASSRDLTSTMKAVLHTTTYIKWEACPHVRASIWRRLELALVEILP